MKKLLLSTLIFAFVCLGLSVISPVPTLAATSSSNSASACEGAGGTADGTACVFEGGLNLETGIKNVSNILVYIVGIASVILLIISGFRYVVSGGDSNAVSGAKNGIIYALIGIVVTFAAYAIVNFVIGEVGKPAPPPARTTYYLNSTVAL